MPANGKLLPDEEASRLAVLFRIRCHKEGRLLCGGPQKEMFFMKKLDTRSITALGLLVAVEIVLSRFCSINAWDLKIGFSFLPVAVAAMRLGPLEAAVSGPP